jgi:serine protease Do
MKGRILYLLAAAIIGITLSLSGCIISFPVPEATTIPDETQPGAAVTMPLNPEWKAPMVKSIPLSLPSFADVIEQVYPSVVAINTETVTLDIFSQPLTQQGAGSGWVLDNVNNGVYVVTNNHVVAGAKSLRVETYDGKTYEVDLKNVKRDAYSDLAVLELTNTNIKTATIGDSSALRVGDWVIALGNPLGQGLKAKEGTVSGVKVSLPIDQGQLLSDLIEVSAPINPGNSGGPLINLAGEVIGITSAKIADVGVEGLGYAISMRTAMPIIQELITRGYVSRPYLGISTVTINQYIYTVNRLPVDKGVVITYLDPNGPASKAGLRRYDIITMFKGSEITSSEELVQKIHACQIGEEVSITYIRNQQSATITVRLVENNPQS